MKYDLISQFKGYATKPDPTNLAPEYLVAGSINCLINDREKLQARPGYRLDGQEDAAIAPVVSSFEWDTSSGHQHALKASNLLLQLRYTNSGGNVSYESLSSLTSVALSFTTWWNNTRKFDELFFVDGTDNLYKWTGAYGTYVSCDATHITIAEDAAAARFSTTGTLRVKDNVGVWHTFTYSGYAGAVFTVTSDPTAFAFTAGALTLEEVIVTADKPAANFLSDFVTTIKNQLVYGSRTSRLLYIAKSSDPTDVTFSTPRIPGDGEVVTLDNSGRAAIAIEDVLLVSAGRDDWYRIEFEQLTVGAIVAEQVRVKKLKTGSGQAALHHDLIAGIGDGVAYLSADHVVRLLGQAENYPDLQTRVLSDAIQPDFDEGDFTGGHMRFADQELLITDPLNSRLYILDLSNIDEPFWQPPQVLPFQRIAIIDGERYAHSAFVPETYKMDDGYSDRAAEDGESGNPIEVIAAFPYRQFGDRGNQKDFEYYRTEGFIALNTVLEVTFNYEYGGAKGQIAKLIEPLLDDGIAAFIFQPQTANVLGDSPLGDLPLGAEETQSDMPRFITDHQVEPKPFFEMQTVYSSNDIDQRWEITSHGPVIRVSPNQPDFIRQ